MVDILTIGLVILYFVIVLFIGFRASKKEDDEGFLLADRNVGTFALTGTMLASLFGGTALVVTMNFIFAYGVGILWAFLSTTLGCFALAALVPKIKRIGDEKGFYTFADYFYNLFSKKVGVIVAAIIFLSYFGYLLVQLIAGGIVLSALTTLPYYLSVLLIGIVIIIYIYAAGFKAIVRTDVFQYLVILLLIFLSLSIFTNASDIDPADLNMFSAGTVNIIGFLLYGIMVLILGAEFWQRIYSAKSISVARRSLVYTGIIFLFLGVLVVLIGLSVKSGYPDIIPTTAIVVGFKSLLPLSLLGIGVVLLFGAVMSSADTFLFVLSSSVAKDFLARFSRFKKIGLSESVRYSTVVIGLLGIIIAILFDQIVDLITSLVGIGFALFPATLFSFWFKFSSLTVLLSILFGILGSVLAFILIGISLEAALVSFPVALIVLGIGKVVERFA